MTAHRSRRKAFTLVEFVLAITLSLIVLTVSVAAASSLMKALAAGRARDGAAQTAEGILAQASQAGCGAGTGADLTHDQALAATCGRIFTENASPLPPAAASASDASFSDAADGVTYSAVFSAAWASTSGGACPTGAAVNGNPSLWSLTAPADLVLDTLTLTWTSTGQSRSQSFTDSSAVAPTAAADSSGVMVDAPAGTPVSLSFTFTTGQTQTTGTTMTRLAVANAAYDPTEAQSATNPPACAWFPYLPAGTAQITVAGATTSLPVPAGETAVVTSP